MKRLALAVAALGFVALGARPAVAQEMMEMKMAEGEDVEFTAQVVDLSCKVVYGLTGEEHRMCAQVCADQGIPLVLLHDGEIYLPVDKAMPGTGANEQLQRCRFAGYIAQSLPIGQRYLHGIIAIRILLIRLRP